ncbi:MAG: galactokinase [Actinomycetota bacterium]
MIAEARSGFKKIFGYEASGVWSAPGRANLIGEHTDYNNGFVFPFGIDRRTYVALSPRQDMLCRVASGLSEEIYEYELSQTMPTQLDWALYPLGVAWTMQEKAKFGFDAYFVSEVPIGAGLSSSAAIECSIGIALNEIWEAGYSKQQIALLGQKAENEVVGAPTGIMDQTASMLAKSDAAVLIDCKTLETELVPLGLSSQGLVVAVIDTRVSHRHSDGGYRSRREACEKGAKIMGVESLRELTVSDLDAAKQKMDDVTFRRSRHVITENQRVLEAVNALRAGEMNQLGQLLLQSHASMRDDFEISIDELDTAVEVAMRVGAVGSRMTGGGFGGAAIAIIDQSKLEMLSAECKREFLANGFAEPNVFAVTPSDGARRDS